MDDENKLPLKRVEFSLTKFNDVAIPHHLDLLRQHKANIIKHEQEGAYVRARAEQTHARRVAAQLRGLLLELDALRRQVRHADLKRFDELTQRSRDTTLRAIVDYLGLIEDSCRELVSSAGRRRVPGTSPLSINRSVAESAPAAASAVSTDSVGVVAHSRDGDVEHEANDALPEFPAQIQLQVDDHAVQLAEREALLRGWSELQGEVRALHDVWQSAQAAALAQRGGGGWQRGAGGRQRERRATASRLRGEAARGRVGRGRRGAGAAGGRARGAGRGRQGGRAGGRGRLAAGLPGRARAGPAPGPGAGAAPGRHRGEEGRLASDLTPGVHLSGHERTGAPSAGAFAYNASDVIQKRSSKSFTEATHHRHHHFRRKTSTAPLSVATLTGHKATEYVQPKIRFRLYKVES